MQKTNYNKNNKRRFPNGGRLLVTLNKKYNGFLFRFHGMRLILVRNCKFFSAFGSATGQDFTAISR